MHSEILGYFLGPNLTLTLTLTGADDDDGRQSRLAHAHIEPIGHRGVGERPGMQICEGCDLYVGVLKCINIKMYGQI